MLYTQLKNTDCKISRFALGTWVFGGTNWGRTNERVLVSAVHAARDAGVNLIDTAPVYGNGKAEEIVGRAIKKKRGQFVLATKCGLIGKGKQTRHDLTRASIFQEIELSLKRLQTDYIDLYQCHWPDPETPVSETMKALKDLQKQGKIRYIGVSNFSVDLLKESLLYADIVTNQMQYSLLERSVENEMLPFLQTKKIGLLTYGSLGGGILSGKYKTLPSFKSSDARSFFYPFYKDQKIQKRLERMESLQKFNRPLNQLALNWLRQQPQVSSVIVGCRTPEQVKQNMESASWNLTDKELKELSSLFREA